MQTCGERFIRETQPGIAFEKETDSLHLFQEIDFVHGFAAVVNLIDNDQKWKSAQCMFDLVFGGDQCALALELNVAKPDTEFHHLRHIRREDETSIEGCLGEPWS